jgi:ferredoxin
MLASCPHPLLINGGRLASATWNRARPAAEPLDCYDLVPDLFGDDEEGFGKVLGSGVVPQEKEREARLAVANCPEQAIDLVEEN